MTRRPRTPVHFPRMKVRGRRNRAKLAARYTQRYVIPSAVVSVDPATGATTFTAAPTRIQGHRIEFTGPTRDGYGRIVAAPVRRPTAAEVAKRQRDIERRMKWGMEFQMKTPMSDTVRELLFGKET